jgi:hypothetical protein
VARTGTSSEDSRRSHSPARASGDGTSRRATNSLVVRSLIQVTAGSRRPPQIGL